VSLTREGASNPERIIHNPAVLSVVILLLTNAATAADALAISLYLGGLRRAV
jgi:hypothetical protein